MTHQGKSGMVSMGGHVFDVGKWTISEPAAAELSSFMNSIISEEVTFSGTWTFGEPPDHVYLADLAKKCAEPLDKAKEGRYKRD